MLQGLPLAAGLMEKQMSNEENSRIKPRHFEVVFWPGEGEKRAIIRDAYGNLVSVKVIGEIVDALRREYPIKTYVYIGFSQIRQLWKIGFTHDVERRAQELRIDVKHFVVCEGSFIGREVERFWHNFFKSCRVRNEWFDLKPTDIELIATISDVPDIAEFKRKLSKLECRIPVEKTPEPQQTVAVELPGPLTVDDLIEQKRRAAIRKAMKRAALRGKHIGRPARPEPHEAFLAKPSSVAAREALGRGLSLREAARAAGVSINTVRKVKEALVDGKIL